MKTWISVILATIAITLGGCQQDVGVPHNKARTISSTAPAPLVEPDSLTAEPAEIVSEVSEDYNDPNDPDYEPRTTVGDEMRQKEYSFTPVGKWGKLFAGLQLNPSVDLAEHMYQEITFQADGTYVWEGWQFGSRFKKRGQYKYDGKDLQMFDKEVLHEEHEGVAEWMWMDHTYGHLDFSGDYVIVQLSSTGNAGFAKGVLYNRTKNGYYDADGNRVRPPPEN